MTEQTAETVLEKPAPDTTPTATGVEPTVPQPAGSEPVADPAQAPETTEAVADWIEAAARGDDKRAERLKRFTDPGALFDSFTSLEAEMSKRGVPLPSEKATPEELAVFAKRVGIPEKPEDYKTKPNLPEGFEFNEVDKGIVASITAELHKRGGILAHPQVVTAMQEVYAKSNEEAQAQLVANAAEIHAATQAALDKEWGADKARNLSFAKGIIERFDAPAEGEGEMSELFQLPLMNGAKLGDYPRFVRLMARIGREFGDDPLFAEIGANGSDNISTLQEQKAAIMKLRADGKHREYDAAQAQLSQINDALQRAARKA